MKVLVVGGGGYVGRIMRAALEAVHQVTYLDLRQVTGAEDRTFVGDLSDDKIVAEALQGQDAVIYMALGVINGDKKTCDLTDPAFNVNLRDQYRVLKAGLELGIRKFITISSLCVYGGSRMNYVIDEDHPTPKAFKSPYGASKRLAEQLYVAAAQNYPDGVYLVLRFNLPQSEEDFPNYPYDPAKGQANTCAMGPKDTCRLMLASLACETPGCHILLTTGDVQEIRFSHARVKALLGWAPVGA